MIYTATHLRWTRRRSVFLIFADERAFITER
jgi:hypothetical protein